MRRVHDSWASDWLTARIMLDPKGNEHLERDDGQAIGMRHDLLKRHRLCDCIIVQPGGGDPGTSLPCGIFPHPQQSGHLWFKTDDLYRILKLTANKLPGIWFQKKRHLFNTMQDQYKLGVMTSETQLNCDLWLANKMVYNT